MIGGAKQKAHLNFGTIFGGLVPPEQTTLARLQAYEHWTFSCVTAISEAFSAINLRLFQMKNGDMMEQQEHEVLDLLFRVNPFQSKADFLQLYATYMELAGEAFIYLERGKENPQPIDPIKELWLLRPDLVEIVPDPVNFIKGYTFRASAKIVPLQTHEVIHVKYPNPINPYRGYSPVQAAGLAIDTFKFSSRWNRAFFFNSAMVSAVLQADGELNDEQYRRLKSEWNSEYQGIDNAHRTAILEHGIEFKPMQMTNRDMEFAKQKEMTRDEILGAFRVPRSVIGITDDVNRANAEATQLVFMRDVIKPKMTRYVDTLNEFLVPLFGDDLILDFDDPTPDNRDQTVSEYVQGHNRWLSTNEIRNLEGLPPVRGGDAIFQSIALLPLGSPVPEPTDEETGDEEVQASMVRMEAPPAEDSKGKARSERLKAKLMAGNKRLKMREAIRRKVELIVEKRRVEITEEQVQNEQVVGLINEKAQLETRVEFAEALNQQKDQAIAELTKEKEEAERIASEALNLNDTENGTTEKDA